MVPSRRIFLALPFASGGGFSLAHAQTTANLSVLQIGAAAIRVPSPVDFVETSSRAPDVYRMALAYSAGDARIIAHYVRQTDLKDFESGKKVYFRQFLLVQTPRRAEQLSLSQDQFDKLRAGTIAMQSQLASKLEPRMAAEIERVSKAVTTTAGASVRINVGEMVPVSIDRDDARALAYSVLATAGATEGTTANTQNMVASASYCFLSGKVVILNAYRVFRSPRDLQENRELLNKWIAALFAAN